MSNQVINFIEVNFVFSTTCHPTDNTAAHFAPKEKKWTTFLRITSNL